MINDEKPTVKCASSPSVLVVDDDPSVIELVSVYSREAGFGEVQGAGTASEGLDLLKAGSFKLVLLDLGLPDRPGSDALLEFLSVVRDIPVAVVTADGRVETAVRCMRGGAYDFIDKPVSPARLLSLLSHAAENTRLRALQAAGSSVDRNPAFDRLVTVSPAMFGLFHVIERLASSPLPVLVTGESGAGKELVAKAIHDLSGRVGPYVPVNIAGLDGPLFADVLFGHARGAYTGADQVRHGLVRKAEGGTLFLDEIGDIGPDIQVKLLRFMQDGEYYPLGSDKPERSACRIILATHVDLAKAVKAGRFRADLYYRLMAHTVSIPALRDRREDIPALVKYFMQQAAPHFGMSVQHLDPAFAAVLAVYDFPGNVRELAAMVYGAVADSSSGRPSLSYVRDYITRQRQDASSGTAYTCPDYSYEIDSRFPPLEELEMQHIREALRRTGGNQSAAAMLLGISQPTISRRIKQLAIQYE
jgi:DNA-binding NtrC family response regulator